MSRPFREWPPDAGWLLPPSPRDWLPEEQLVYFLLDVTGQVELSPIVDDDGGENGGQPPSGIASEERLASPAKNVWHRQRRTSGIASEEH